MREKRIVETKTKISALKKLYGLGQSPWYDNIDRRLLNDGRLKDFIARGIVGLTSNPSIFQKAVAASDIYDEQIDSLAKKGKTAKEIYDEVTISDVCSAADLLKDTYLKTGGIDGYVSIEVYPEYAHDPDKTVEYAKSVYGRIGRDNIMIKVPGTEPGYKAIRSLISDGVNVNVTLLFSLAHYEKAALAYINGLRDRLDKGASVSGIASVASLFVSRIDTKIDKKLEDMGEESLKGRPAVANAKMIYRKFKEIFSGKDFSDLRESGAWLQRPLWASTSTKNADYSDVKYIEELVGENTINTIPHATMEAFLDHGKPFLTIEEDLDGAKECFRSLAGRGINMEEVCQSIQDEGVKAFQASFDKLIDVIERRGLTK